jgi:deferrochelatase/peroxidase EfeB
LPAFATDSLESAICGGDIAVQACADDPQVAFHAIHDLIRLASPAAVPRWSLAGFGRTLNRRSGPTPRNLLGFKEGTGNVMSDDTAALERYVWARRPASPAWMEGGSYMVVSRNRPSGATSSPGRRSASATSSPHSICRRGAMGNR